MGIVLITVTNKSQLERKSWVPRSFFPPRLWSFRTFFSIVYFIPWIFQATVAVLISISSSPKKKEKQKLKKVKESKKKRKDYNKREKERYKGTNIDKTANENEPHRSVDIFFDLSMRFFCCFSLKVKQRRLYMFTI